MASLRLGASFVLPLALVVVSACSSGHAGEGHEGTSGTAAAATVPRASSATAGAPSDSAAAADPGAHASPATLPPRVPESERPSAKVSPPPGVKVADWRRIFDSYGHLLDLDHILDDLHRDHPDITEIHTLGTTHQGRPIRALLVADRPSAARGRPAMLLNGAHHGDEPLSSDIVLDAITTLLAGARADPKIRRYLSELAIWCVPMVNRDGFAQFMADFGAGRKNGRETRRDPAHAGLREKGVDLNRNYPFRWGAHGERGSSKRTGHRFYRGPEPGSEPETKAMTRLGDREHFVGSISYHIGTVALLAPYTVDGVPVPAPNEAWLVAEHVARHMPKLDRRSLPVRKNLYTVDGVDQDHHRFAHGTLALLLESAARSWETPALRRGTLEGVRPAWGLLFDRYLDGPSVEGRVKDEAGRPVSAKVDVSAVVTRAGEVWRSRCSDGFFGRYLPAFGAVTVRVTPPGGGPVIEKSVESTPEKGRVVVDFVVPGGGPTGCEAE